MSTVSASPASLRKIDFVDAMLQARGIEPLCSAAFDQPGALGIACMSFKHRLHSYKPAHQDYHGIGYRLSGAETIRLDKPTSFPGRTGITGMTAIVPAEEESRWESLGPHDMVHFYLSARFLATLATQVFGVDGARLQMREAGFHHDPTIALWASMFRDRLSEPDPMTEMELNAAAQLLGVHLVRHYTNLADRLLPDAESRARSALSPSQLQRVRDYVRANLSRELGLAELAEQAALSPHYFSTVFKNTLGVSPHRYVLGERIREAQRQLAARRQSICEIALGLGFSDQSHFSQTFRKLTGTTPKRFQLDC
jgi:AraC family transcriptional regulator